MCAQASTSGDAAPTLSVEPARFGALYDRQCMQGPVKEPNANCAHLTWQFGIIRVLHRRGGKLRTTRKKERRIHEHAQRHVREHDPSTSACGSWHNPSFKNSHVCKFSLRTNIKVKGIPRWHSLLVHMYLRSLITPYPPFYYQVQTRCYIGPPPCCWPAKR